MVGDCKSVLSHQDKNFSREGIRRNPVLLEDLLSHILMRGGPPGLCAHRRSFCGRLSGCLKGWNRVYWEVANLTDEDSLDCKIKVRFDIYLLMASTFSPNESLSSKTYSMGNIRLR